MSPLRFLARDDRFFDLLQRAANNTLEGTRVLVELLEHCADHARLARTLEDLEHAGDELTHEILRELNRTFIPPIDREDIGGLASAIDDVIDRADHAAQRIQANHVAQCTPLARQMGHLVLEQAEQIAAAVPKLSERDIARALERPIQEIHRLENEGDDLLSEAIFHLYNDVTTVPDVIQARCWEDIYQVLEDATDKAERVATVLRNIALKNA